MLRRLGRENLDAIEATVQRYGIECDCRRSGAITVATQPHQVEWLADEPGDFLDRDAVRTHLDSPTYLAGVWDRDETAMVDPARLAWGLASDAESLDVRIVESTRATGIRRERDGVEVATSTGHAVRARRVALGTNAFPSLLRRTRLHTVPVYDYALMTEPLSDQQLAGLGWSSRAGVGDMANQFHYYRLTEDNRVM